MMKRFPNGVGGKAFYQQRSREERPPAGVRIETLADELDPISEPDAKRLDRRIADDAAVHDADRGDLAGPVVLARAVAARRGPRRDRSRSDRRRDVLAVLDVARWVRDELHRSASPAFPRPPAPAACTSTCRCRRARRTSRECCSVRSSRRSWRRDTRRWRRSSAWSRAGRAARCTSTSCRTSSARRWRPPTARARATSPACPRR